MNIRLIRPLRGLDRSVRMLARLAVLAAVLAPAAAVAQQTPFVLVNGGVFDGPGNEVEPEVTQVSATGPLLLPVGSLPTATGRFRSSFGSNGFQAQTTGGIDREVDGGSAWSDGFLVTGGSGSGSLPISAGIHGTVTGDAEMFFGVYVSAQPFDVATMFAQIQAAPNFSSVQFPNATRVMFTGVANRCGLPGASADCGQMPFQNYDGPIDLTLNFGVPFTYGQRFYVLSVFGGGIGVFGGSVDFFNSADFGINAPAGATLSTLSGAAYPPAVVVPEPATWLLMLAGVALLVRRRRR